MCCVQALVQELGIRALRPHVMKNLTHKTLRLSLDWKRDALKKIMRNKDQKNVLYPPNNSDVNLNALDLSLWAFLAEHVTNKSKFILPCSKERGHKGEECYCDWKTHAMNLRTIRNRLAHLPSVKGADWKAIVEDAERALRGLGIPQATITASKRRKFDHIKELAVIPSYHFYKIPTGIINSEKFSNLL